MPSKKPTTKKKPTGKKKTETIARRRRGEAATEMPPPETFDFCDGITEANGDPAIYTDKERQFVFAYLTDAKFEATKAAEIAGYDASNRNTLRVIACQLMKRHRIREAINVGLEAITFPKFEALFRVAEIAKSSIADVMDDDARYYDPEKAIRTGAIENIHSIEITERIVDTALESVEYPDDLNLPANERRPKETIEQNVIERKYKIKMYSKLTALKVLTDVNFAKKHELSGKDGEALPLVPANVLILPDNGRGDSPEELAERAKRAPGTKKKG